MSEHRDSLTPQDEERLARYRSGEMTSEEHRAFEAELLTSDLLMEALYQDVSLAESLRELRPGTFGAGPEQRSSFWRSLLGAFHGWRIWIPVAATAAVALLILRPPKEPTVRGELGVTRAIAPIGTLKEPPARFVWSASPGAIRYRFVLYDAQFHVVSTQVVSDTSLAAAGLLPVDLERGAWQVTPIDSSDQPLAPTPPARFQITR